MIICIIDEQIAAEFFLVVVDVEIVVVSLVLFPSDVLQLHVSAFNTNAAFAVSIMFFGEIVDLINKLFNYLCE